MKFLSCIKKKKIVELTSPSFWHPTITFKFNTWKHWLGKYLNCWLTSYYNFTLVSLYLTWKVNLGRILLANLNHIILGLSTTCSNPKTCLVLDDLHPRTARSKRWFGQPRVTSARNWHCRFEWRFGYLRTRLTWLAQRLFLSVSEIVGFGQNSSKLDSTYRQIQWDLSQISIYLKEYLLDLIRSSQIWWD